MIEILKDMRAELVCQMPTREEWACLAVVGVMLFVLVVAYTGAIL